MQCSQSFFYFFVKSLLKFLFNLFIISHEKLLLSFCKIFLKIFFKFSHNFPKLFLKYYIIFFIFPIIFLILTFREERDQTRLLLKTSLPMWHVYITDCCNNRWIAAHSDRLLSVCPSLKLSILWGGGAVERQNVTLNKSPPYPQPLSFSSWLM